jgi:CheY-like chemotaxis protein
MDNEKLILVVDDSRTTRSFLCAILENNGFTTQQAENGLEAIKFIQNQLPDGMILDLLMPEMDGFEVLAKLKELKLKFPVFVLTADIQEEVREECFSLGAKGFINKPFKEKDIMEIIMKTFK